MARAKGHSNSGYIWQIIPRCHKKLDRKALISIQNKRAKADTMKAITRAIKARGQLTVPKKIRDMLKLEEGQAVTFLTIGDSVIISPKRLDLDEARRQIRRIVKESGLTEAAILSDLNREREALYREKYGKKKS